jgi:phage internal scaffolding protein
MSVNDEFGRPYIYSAFDRPQDSGIVFTMPTMAQQHFKDECDINSIMKRYTQTGLLPQSSREFFYGDVSEQLDYRQALDFLNNAQDNFDALPAVLRKRFDNDPGQLLDFLANPDNREEAVRLGLVEPTNSGGTPTTESGSTKPSNLPSDQSDNKPAEASAGGSAQSST